VSACPSLSLCSMDNCARRALADNEKDQHPAAEQPGTPAYQRAARQAPMAYRGHPLGPRGWIRRNKPDQSAASRRHSPDVPEQIPIDRVRRVALARRCLAVEP